MQVNIKTKKVELTEKIQKHIQEKMNSLEKYLKNTKVMNCDFEISLMVGGQSKGEIYKAELNLELPGNLISVEKTGKDVLVAIDKVKEHAVILIKKKKEKSISKKKREGLNVNGI